MGGFSMKCVPVMDKVVCCCCSCSLRAATLTLAWLGMIGQVMDLVTGVIHLASPERKNLNTDSPIAPHEVAIVQVSLSVISILIVGLLLYGVHKEKPTFMLPYLIVGLIGIILGVVCIIVFSIIVIISNVIDGVVFFLVGFLIFALMAYFWTIIYNYYRQLVDGQQTRPGAPLENFVAVKTNDQEPRPYYEFPYRNQSGQETA